MRNEIDAEDQKLIPAYDLILQTACDSEVILVLTKFDMVLIIEHLMSQLTGLRETFTDIQFPISVWVR